ncbi:MAG: hypothetical protein HN341_04885, partial [Verrucomicrobia bacterium]|nr:hypothetical protein [Verrucomicrobiota bacterium]
SSLRDACQNFGKVISGKSTLPVLGCVRFHADGKDVTAQATDLDQVIEYRFDGAEVSGDGACIIPFTALKDLAKGSKDECVDIETEDPLNISVTNHVGGHAVRRVMPGMDLDEWPTMHVEMQTKTADGFIETYRRLVPFSSIDDTRYVLNSIFVEIGHGKKPVTMVATDGKRLGCFNSMVLPLKKSVIVPTTKFLGWPGAGTDVEIGVREDGDRVWLGVRSGPLFYAVKCVDGTYPNFRQVIPAEPGEHVITFTDSDVDLLKQVLPSLPGDDVVTIVGHEGKVSFFGRGPDDEDWTKVSLDASTYSGSRSFIGVNRLYLLDALAAGFREFAITDELSPLLSRDGNGGTHVVMPFGVLDPEDTGETAQPTAEAAPAVEAPVKPEAVAEPIVEPEPPAKKTTTRRTKVPKNEQRSETPAMERVVTACDAARTKVKEAGQALSELATAIKDAARDQKGQAKDVEAARAALSKLQAISL